MALALYRGDAKIAHDVVMRLLDGLWNVGHYIIMDNFFSSIGLFLEFLSKDTYATRTIRVNHVGLLTTLKNTKVFKKEPQGTTFSQMHNFRQISCAM